MSKLLLLFFIVNIVLTSCTVTKIVQKSTATAKAVLNGGSSSAAVSATTLTKTNTNSEQGGTNDLDNNTNDGNNNNEYPIVNNGTIVEEPYKVNENNIYDRNNMNHDSGNVGNEYYYNNNHDDIFDSDEIENDDDDDINDKDDDINDDKDDDDDDDFICNSQGYDCRACGGALRNMTDAANFFAMQVVYFQLNTYTTEIISAPLNVFYLVCVYALYTFGSTWERAKVFCGVETKDQIRCTLDVISEFTENQPRGIEYRFASVYAYLSEKMFTKPFKRDAREIASARPLYFNIASLIAKGSQKAKRIINKNIARDTKYRIRNALSNSSILKPDPNASKVVLIGGIYFMSMFERGYDLTNLTEKEYTDLDGETTLVPFAYQVDILDFAYLEYLDSKVLSVPYKDGYFNVIVILPTNPSIQGILDLAEKMKVRGIIRKIKNDLRKCTVEFHAPVFNGANARIDIGEILRETDLDILFDPATAEVENGFGQRVNEYISDIYQKVVIKPDLTGDKPPSNVAPKGSDNLKKVSFILDHTALIFIENKGVIRFARASSIA